MTTPAEPARQTILRAATILSVGILLSRILGFLREAVIAYLHGASADTDAYYAAFTLPASPLEVSFLLEVHMAL